MKYFTVVFFLFYSVVAYGQSIVASPAAAVCAGTNVVLSVSPPAPGTYQWLNGGVSTGVTSSTYTPGVSGSYSVVITNGGVPDTLPAIAVTINPLPTPPAFTFTANGQCANIPVNFNVTDPVAGFNYTWSFGDGSTGTGITASHPYIAALGSGTQSFTASVTATSAAGCSTASATQTITVNQIPDPQLADTAEFSPFNNCGNNTGSPIYTLTVNNITPNQASISGYMINWGDGGSNVGATSFPLTHTYNDYGVYTITFTATNAVNGCTNIKTYTVINQLNPAVGIEGPPGGSTQRCDSAGFWFKLKNYLDNSPGTIYIWNFGDGSPNVVWTSPVAVDSIYHVFNKSSCELPGKEFIVSVTAQNRCDATTANINNIKIFKKPKADFGINPSPGCTNTPINFTNASITAFNGPDCNGITKYLWNFGDPGSGAQNTDTAKNPTHIYANPGVYTVSLSAAGVCGADSIKKTVCITPPPVPGFTLDQTTGCGPVAVTVTNTTNTFNACAPATYKWRVDYAAGFCGTTAAWNFTNGTNDSSLNPSFTFINPGTYTVSLLVASPCPSDSISKTIIVKQKPQVTINPIAAICSNGSINPSAVVVGCSPIVPLQYNWVFTGGLPDTSINATPGNIIFTTLGSHPIQLSVTNECGTTIAPASINVTAPPVANAGPDIVICSEASAPIGTTGVTGVAYQWSPATGLSNPNADVNTVTISYNGANADTVYTYVVTASAGADCSSTDSVNVTVKKRPQVVPNPVAATVCEGGTVQLTAAGAVTYSWLPATGLSSTTGDTVVATPPASTIYQVIGTNANVCADTASVSITIQPYPATNAGNDSTVCNNTTSVQFTGSPAGGTWAGGNVTSSGLFNPLAVGNGAYTLYYTAANGQCSKTDSLVVSVINPPVVNAGSDTTICQNNSTILLAGSPGGGVWSGTPFVTAEGVFSPSATGAYQAIYTYGAGSCIASDTVMVTVGPGITNNIISPDQSVCVNKQALPIGGPAATGGNSAPAYQWQISTDSLTWADIPGETGLNYSPPVLTASTFYRRVAFTTLCSGTQGSISNVVKITIRQDAKALFTGNPLVSCSPFDLAQAITVTPFPDQDNLYQWTANGVPIGTNATGVFPGFIIPAPNDTVLIKLITTSPYGCQPDSIQQQFITVITAEAQFTKDTGSGCAPLPVTFTNTSSIINGINFNWDFGNGLTTTAVQPGTVIFNASPDNRDTVYQLTLKAFNGCDTTVWRDSVKIRANPKARFGVDTTFGCSPFTVHISNTSLGAPNTYYWNFGDGHVDTTYTTGTLNYTYNSGPLVDTVTIQLIAANECKRDTQTLNLRIAPNIINANININSTDLFGCAPHNIAISNTSTGATLFTWNFGDGSPTVITDANQNIVPHNYTDTGTFNIKVDITNGCSDTTVYRAVTVYAKPTAAFTTDKNIYCQGDTVHVTNTSTNATNYQWFWGDGTGDTGPVPVHVYTAPGNYTIYLRAEKTNSSGPVCSDTLVRQVTVLGRPDVSVQSNISTLNCAPFTLTVSAPGIINENAVWYFYDSTVTPAITVIPGANAQYTFNKPGTFYAKLLAQNIAGCSDSALIPFTVQGMPVASFTPLNLSVCTRDTTVSYINTSTYNGNDAIRYNWLVDNVPLSANGNFTHRYTAPPLAVLPKIFNTWLIVSNTVGCSDTAKAILQMNPSAKAQFSINNPDACVPFIAAISNNSLFATSFKWLVNGVVASTDSIPQIAVTQATAPYTITLIADNIYGCGADTFSVTFTSRVKPVASFALSDTLGCTGILNVATNNTTTNANTYTWDWGDNTPVSNFINPTHLYTNVGEYRITLVANDGVCRDTASRLVKVGNKPSVDFTVNTTLTCDTARVQFINQTVNGTNYVWDFGDGTGSTDINPSKTYAPSAVPYTVKLVATNGGCKDSAVKANLVLAKVPPVADFFISPTPTITVPDYTFSFNNLTLNNNNYQYLWSLGDGSIAVTRDVLNHKYADTGSYPIRLIVLDNLTNCTDTTIKIARITGFPGWMYIPNAVCPNCLQENLRTFLPKGSGLAQYHLQIFTTWGELVFESTSLDSKGSPNEPWDVKYKGGLVIQDAYVWKIQAKYKNGSEWLGMIYPGETKYKKAGSITVVR